MLFFFDVIKSWFKKKGEVDSEHNSTDERDRVEGNDQL